ncbi:hypothetical protein CGRA01v4_11819 [Colletotrichum graminicola]|nr:hypothetical protein CGRA01v4_11819 [Colletotrichum graminicola]
MSVQKALVRQGPPYPPPSDQSENLEL